MKSFGTLVKSQIITMEPKAEILGIGGSPRKKGNSDVLLKQILAGAEGEDMPTSMIQLRDMNFQGCIGCEKCRKDKICTGLNDGMSLLYLKIISSRGLILVSPTHNYNITSWMKAFIDRLYCFYNFSNSRPRAWSSQLADQGRRAVIVAICEQESKEDMGFTLEAMRMPLEALGYDVMEALAVFKIFERGRVKEYSEILDKAAILGKQLAGAIS